jgi:hypothetical protein
MSWRDMKEKKERRKKLGHSFIGQRAGWGTNMQLITAGLKPINFIA